jgi:hypothetical protein
MQTQKAGQNPFSPVVQISLGQSMDRKPKRR